MSTTPFMNLTLPVPSVTLGPQWANELNTALSTIDSHDHSNGNGTTIKTAGIEINADLDFNEFAVFGLKSAKLATQSAVLTGSTHAQSVWSYNGDLYYTSAAGIAVQVTSGGALAAVPSSVVGMDFAIISSNATIPASGTLVLYSVDTTAPRAITLPSPSAVAPGRLFIFKDRDGQSETNPITFTSAVGSIDLQASVVLASNLGSIMLASDGNTNWLVI